MDYAPYYAHSPHSYGFVGITPTPPYTGADGGKMDTSQDMDPSLFPASYDAFRSYSHPLSASPVTTSAPYGPLDAPLGGGLHDAAGDGSASARGRDRRSSSEEKELTPAQYRRKAQNRAAQRAFRERKERHVKDLEAKLEALESSATSLATDNQRLKLALQRANTENEILRARGGREGSWEEEYEGADGGWSESVRKGGEGGALLQAHATWDVIQGHRLVKAGYVDVADVCERLRGKARCDGGGPVFSEWDVLRAVEESRRGGGDELI
ncbi:hypothetical protein EJ06DRAFT_566172 [Trichodelitschia bisporula]|uniref:BZIP domain-containing protein n=1 Tax=Trichodelitschia bisporula TaxID=703511 RepID=A0A6G1HMQ0_9PEZI|nr:hypothetical protein EJ06DRAFT_566172 [Trichodelitschia bisporula]